MKLETTIEISEDELKEVMWYKGANTLVAMDLQHRGQRVGTGTVIFTVGEIGSRYIEILFKKDRISDIIFLDVTI